MDNITEAAGGVNVYNYREIGDYNFDYYENYLRSSSVKTKFGVPDSIDFRDCNDTVYDYLLEDNALSKAWKMPYILS